LLPTPRPQRAVPVRHACWLLAVAEDKVLLRQRAAEGLWGGLWVPPSFESAHALESAARAWGSVVQWLPPRRHGFTHYTLEFTPALLSLARVPAVAREPGVDWFAASALASLALPAPVKRLVQDVLLRPADLVASA
jgi:A/G-specific adenine glycosylase